jgi:hypothetical protein
MKGANDNEVTTGKVVRQLIVIAGLVVSVLMIIFFIYPWGGWLPSVLLFFVTVLMLVRAYSAGHRYRCANCDSVFRVPVTVDLFTGGGIGKNPDGTYHNWKSLTCPQCGQRTRAVVVKVDPEPVPRKGRLTAPAPKGETSTADTDAPAGPDSARTPSSGRSPHAKRRKTRR